MKEQEKQISTSELEGELAVAAGIRYLTRENAQFVETAGHMLAVTVEGEEHVPVYVHCSFPHTHPHLLLSVRTAENKEVGMIRDLAELDEATRALLERQLVIRYFTPEITELVSIKEEFGYSYWEAHTSAGTCRFTVRSGGGNVKYATEERLLVTDVDGNRFVIPYMSKLSEKEHRMLEVHM